MIGSTNERLRELAAGGAAPFSVVVAHEQTAGRGRAGKAWVSPPGGLWFSILIPEDGGPISSLIPLLSGLAVSRAVTQVTGIISSLKWPNDVLVGPGKLAGILCEAVRDGLVVTGIGVNVQAPKSGWPPTLVEHPTALMDHLNIRPPGLRPALLGQILLELRKLLQTTSLEDFQAEWCRLDALQGREVVCSTGAEGTAQGIGADGGLRVETPEGLVVVRAGSVRLRNTGNSANTEQAVSE